MAAYVVIQVNVTDPEKYSEYKKLSPDTVAQFGGKFLARGGRSEDLEGKRPYDRLVILEFPSYSDAQAWYRSPEYQAAKAVREGAGEGVFTVVEGV